MKDRKNYLILYVILTVGHALSANVYGQSPQIIIQKHPEYKETSYTILTDDSRKISLTTYQTEINRGILRLRSNSDLAFAEQIDLFSRILGNVFERENIEEIHTLFIGRLLNAFGDNNTQMSERLALSAYTSSVWDSAGGKPVSGHENLAVKDIANKARIFSELGEIFARHGLVIKVSGAEKVLIAQPDRTPFGDSLKSKGIEKISHVRSK